MCGIAGRVNFSRSTPVSRELVERMTDALAHRGPDGRGCFVAEGAGLGHRRLSIIDLATGDQPLANEDQTIWTVFNGEIYNFADLREELTAHGHQFRTQSDTEVIVHAYEQWGDGAVERLRGMFAFAVWDLRRRRLLLARDRLGIKPLHYALVPGGLVFGSEIKALLEDGDVPRDWSADALDAYLALQYVPTPRTIFKAIWKLPPAHLLTLENGAVAVRRYWTLEFPGDGERAREDEYLERLEALVDESVKLRLISDVPLGAFLSGGIDSSTVLASMVKTCGSRVQALSVGFDEQAFNELEYARQVGDHLDADVHERIVHADVADLMPTLAWHFDEPFADSSAVPTYYVSAAARERVTVALSGDGGDELWAGYARHRVERWELAARGWLGPLGARLAGRVGGRLPLALRGIRSLRHLGLSPAEACALKHAYGLFEHDRGGLYSRDFAIATEDADPFAGFRRTYASCSSADPLDRALCVDVHTYLVDDILTKVDRMSMAVGLEARVPLLDHRLVEFAATVPTGLKLAHGRSKHLLRRLIERRLPPAIVNRPKQGFAVPVDTWLRTSLLPMMHDLLLDGRLRTRGIFETREVARLVQEHTAGRRSHGHRLWSLMMLELWFRQFVDGRRYSPRAGKVAA